MKDISTLLHGILTWSYQVILSLGILTLNFVTKVNVDPGINGRDSDTTFCFRITRVCLSSPKGVKHLSK